MSRLHGYFRLALRNAVQLSLSAAFLFFVFALLIVRGGVDTRLLNVITFCFTAVFSISAVLRPVRQHLKFAYFSGFVLALLIACATAFQLLPRPGPPQGVDTSLISVEMATHTASISPADTLLALPVVLMPFAVFLASLLIFRKYEDAERAIKAILIAGFLVGVFGFLQFKTNPHRLLFDVKSAYLRSYTFPFVNPNTAATFYGLNVILAIGLLIDRWIVLRTSRRNFRTAIDRAFRDRWFLAIGAMLAFELIALSSTSSRAGIASTFVSLLLFFGIPLVFAPGLLGAPGTFGHRSGKAVLLRLGLFAGALVLAAMLADRALLRLAVQGFDDGRFCVYPGIVRMIEDHWVWGVGLGNFALAFTGYRPADCGIAGSWDKAHSFFLEGWVTLGVTFVVVCTLALAALLFVFVKGIRNRKMNRWAPMTGLAALALVALHGILDFSLQIPGFSVFFAAVLGPLVVISLRPRRPAARGASSERKGVGKEQEDFDPPVGENPPPVAGT